MQSAKPGARIAILDMARGLALIAMASYHFGWDLELFGYVEPGTATTGWMRWYARFIASSFLMLVGISLFLAHAKEIRWPRFLNRLMQIAAAALAVTAATYFALDRGFIFFGILHQIAVGSIVGLAFLRLPSIVTFAFSMALLAAPIYLRSSQFDHPWLWWVGLSTVDPASSDYVPVMPWTGMILLGIVIAKTGHRLGWFDTLSKLGPYDKGPGHWLGVAGRHGLLFYLVHQPILIFAVYAFSLGFPPSVDQTANFQGACVTNCMISRDEPFCQTFCSCVQASLEEKGKLDDLVAGKLDPQSDPVVLSSAGQCTLEAQENGK